MRKKVDQNNKCMYEEPKSEIVAIEHSDIITTSPGDENWGDEWDGRE